MPESKKQQYQSLCKLSDLRFPSEWFPEARQMQRKIFMHVGPTNSGKTYHAIQRLQKAESGIYCGPLRLLAHEIYDKMNAQGIACNLLTGEENREVSPTAALTSSTVEMANFAKPLEVAVIDEIQLIADADRGWAWTQALLGLKAKEIHLCGEASAVPLVKKICESLGEEVIVNEYSRLTPVSICDQSIDGDLTKIQPGDCVVAFSRQQIFALKEAIEAQAGLKCAVAYGALPPETRALQAKRFNDPASDLQVLVASDAVGMGLNLNIKRVIFSTVSKFNGSTHTHVPVPQIKQIAGRAGRFGTAYGSGEVTTLGPKDLDYVHEALDMPTIPLKLAGLQPTFDIIEVFALQMPNEKYSTILQKFEDIASVSGNYFLCNFKDHKVIADAIEHIKLPLRDRYVFVTAPVSTKKYETIDLVGELAKVHSDGGTLDLNDIIDLPEKTDNPSDLTLLEVDHKKIMLYMWLRYEQEKLGTGLFYSSFFLHSSASGSHQRSSHLKTNA
ncbi:P-loop containing nucleoside triphosphate hydrolase protein [Hesseltinella vesiculosa]|uniref:RNA helicase n=1 Tax=Hesseltinella vesiculosa TaxID=101127 RepID=A0A1X2GSL7_9FUNG|nr:P-loop containing nucleoside triphosphate hydrolase protein [Hesseltinella vesiculosa]